MTRKPSLFLLLLLISGFLNAQVPQDTAASVRDTTILRDSIPGTDTSIFRDTLAAVPPIDSVPPQAGFQYDARLQWKILSQHPYLHFNGTRVTRQDANLREYKGKDLLFYLLVFILLVFAFLKRAFPKYFSDLFRLFFRTTIKQRQIREQLMQTPLPSILLNGFFVISTGLYISFLFLYFGVDPVGNFWLLYVYCMAALTLIYLVKFIVLRFAGWLFNVPQAAGAYIFVVFIINKMIGILLLPFLVLLAFTSGNLYLAAMALSWCLIIGLLLYRLILTYGALRNQVRVNIFHFLLYLLAFEVVPVLLIYKALMSYLLRSS